MKKVLVILANGFEEIEALTVVDILRRAKTEVTLAGLEKGLIKGRSGIKVLTEVDISEVSNKTFDVVVLPGGLPGADNLKKNRYVLDIIKRHFNKKRYIAAICAGPTILSHLGLTKGITITSHPSVKSNFMDAKYCKNRVAVDGVIISSRAPGTAMDFSFKIIELLFGKEKVEEINKGVLAII